MMADVLADFITKAHTAAVQSERPFFLFGGAAVDIDEESALLGSESASQ